MLNEAQVLSSSFHISVGDIVYESMRLRLPVSRVGGEGVEVGAGATWVQKIHEN